MLLLAWTAAIGAAIATFALVLTIVNLSRYRPAPPARPAAVRVSVCVPARNEEANIEACVRAALASTGVDVEVVVNDDESSDGTPRILARLAAEDPRVRLTEPVPCPPGWNGKQHGCWRCAQIASGDWLLFTDADVRLQPDCLARTLAAADEQGADLVSTFPRQRIGSLGEALTVPTIFFLLLAYLPMGRMRKSADPASSAGCGQFLFVRRDAYFAFGGHSAFPDTMHDGIRMPRAARRHGFRTDLFDGTDLVECRMYHGFRQSWRGFAKNAYEGLGSPVLLVVLTILHLVGHILPPLLLVAGLLLLATSDEPTLPLLITLGSATALAAGIATRLALCRRFRLPYVSALLHPVTVALMTAIQWHSLYLQVTGKRSWRGRTAPAQAGGSAHVGGPPDGRDARPT